MINERDLAVDLLAEDTASMDERRWDEWLALHAEDCEYWVPCWAEDDALVDDPNTGMSHIYYATRAGLEDRVWRIRSRRSPASMPMPRTMHMVGNVQARRSSEATIEIKANWVNHVFDLRLQREITFFGRYQHLVELTNDGPIYKKKKVILLNDYIETYFDIYHV